MKKIDQLLLSYSESHQTSFNQKVHYVCVPAIFFSLLGLLYCIPVSYLFSSYLSDPWLRLINLATVLVLFGALYYAMLSIPLMVGMIVLSLASFYLIFLIEKSQIAPLWVVMSGIFIVAWVGQFIGHQHEGKKPSFLQDLQFLMIGPAWTLSHLYNRIGVSF